MRRWLLAVVWLLLPAWVAPAFAADAAARIEPRVEAVTYAPLARPRFVVQPWPAGASDDYVLQVFPGLTFKQGQAPIHVPGDPMPVADNGGMGLGVGLEGRLGARHGWQVLANYSPTAFSPIFDPRFSLHGFWLPQPAWGLDGELNTDLRGQLSGELATSWLLAEPHERLFGVRQARLSVGRRTAGVDPGYGYGQVALLREWSPWGAYGTFAVFTSTAGGWRGSLDAAQDTALNAHLRVRTDASLGTSIGLLPAGDRLGAGLLSHDWLTGGQRASARVSLLAPLWQGLALPLGTGTLRQIEGKMFTEGGRLWAADPPARDGVLAGVGGEIVLIQDTILGFPLALSLGYAMPIWAFDAPTSPLPGRFYFTTTAATFPLLQPGAQN